MPDHRTAALPPPLPTSNGSPTRPRRRPLAAGAAALGFTAAFAAASSGPARAQVDPALTRCAEIGASADRLVCYDRLAGRAAEPPVPAAAAPSAPSAPSVAAAAMPPATTTLAPADTATSQTREASAVGGGLLSKFWELDRGDKRGVFNFTGYQPNYALPVHVTTRINHAPDSPTHEAVDAPDYRRLESKIQISLRTKLVQDLLVPGLDIWAAYTQQSLWQVYNSDDSRPFRSTDYQPELMAVTPVPEAVRYLPFGLQWRYWQFGLAHQSNGQSDPLSRSWNRVYFGTGLERGDVSFTAAVQHRLHEKASSDDNPDLIGYRGRADFQLAWTPGAATASLQYRSNLKSTNRGSLLFEWTYPVFRDQPNGLRWYMQAFTGYSETLTDYNFRQTSAGAGLTFLQF